MAAGCRWRHHGDMARTSDLHPLSDAAIRPAAGLEAAPTCDLCGLEMYRSEMRATRRAIGAVGALARPLIALPTWKCCACGRQQPRITP